ncbi:hypothetical protein SAMN06893096_10758 [Geodermatophilus pulveris]|uniref:Uncharacterized protein n=1 Tax=Geodermatophilus pulveris TaxID=1564159 RepID=A0A239GUF3_9ACTN|nr:hypothetical protein SAMN06893096_10758 [Geodermatophilus pulveris]
MTTILLTTQYLEEADRMVVLDRGRVTARGTADELEDQVGGQRRELSFGEAVGGFLVLPVFACAVSWPMAVVGLLVRTPEVVDDAGFIVILPLGFVAHTFVPLSVRLHQRTSTR